MKNKLIVFIAIYAMMANVLYGHTNTTTLSRLQLVHPDLGYDGGAALHTAIDTLYTRIGDNANSRYKEYSGVANSTVTTFEHNFGAAFAEYKILLYTGIGTSKVRVTSPTGAGWTIAATSGFTTTKIDITTPSSGGPHTFSIVVTHGRGAEKLSDLDDIDFTTPPSSTNVLTYNGSKWAPGVNSTPSAATSSTSGVVSAVTQSFGGGKTIVGNVDEIQLLAKGNSTQTANTFEVQTSAAVKLMEVKNDGTLKVNSSASESLQVNGSAATALNGPTYSHYGSTSTTNGGFNQTFKRSRNSTVGSQTIVASGDVLGKTIYQGSDGVAFKSSASIDGVVDTTPGLNIIPGRLAFNVADAAGTLTERMRIASDGKVTIGTDATTYPGTIIYGVKDATAATTNAVGESSVSAESADIAMVHNAQTDLTSEVLTGGAYMLIGTFHCAVSANSGENIFVNISNGAGIQKEIKINNALGDTFSTGRQTTIVTFFTIADSASTANKTIKTRVQVASGASITGTCRASLSKLRFR